MVLINQKIWLNLLFLIKFMVHIKVLGTLHKGGPFCEFKTTKSSNREGVKYKVLHLEKSEKRPKRSVYKVLRMKYLNKMENT